VKAKDTMAIVKASYKRSPQWGKLAIKYMQRAEGKNGKREVPTLFNFDGAMERKEAYQVIHEAKKGSYFFRFLISPDPVKEDTNRDIFLREVTEKTMLGVEDCVGQQIQWVAATHDDHAPHRHVHVLAILPKRLQVQDLQEMRQSATEAALFQRRQRDAIYEARQKQERGKKE